MRSVKVIVGCVAVGTFGASVLAQGEPPARNAPRPARVEGGQPQVQVTPRNPPLSAEKAKAAWALEATGVAKRLGVDESKVKDVVKAYTEARTSHEAAAEKMREERRNAGGGGGGGDGGGPGGGPGGGRGQEAMRAMQDLNKAEREKFQKALGSILSADQVTKAVASLGTFNRSWDQMADTIGGFKLEPAKQQDALNAIEDFIVTQSKLAAQAGPDADRQALNAQRQESRQKLNEALKKTLTEEQFKKFESTQPGGGRPRGPRPDGEGGGPGGGAGGGGF